MGRRRHRLARTILAATCLLLLPGPTRPQSIEEIRRLPPLPLGEEEEVRSQPRADATPAKQAPGPGPQADPESTLEKSFEKLAQVRNREALRHYEQGDYPKALAALRAAYDLDSTDPEITNNLAYLLDRLGNHAEAEALYTKALELDPDRYVAHINLADLLIERATGPRKLEEAAQHLVRARELKGNRPSVILRQARVAARLGRFRAAELHYRELSQHEDPTDARYLEIGDFYLDFGREEEALTWYRKARGTGEAAAEAARRVWQLAARRQARRYGWRPDEQEIPERVREMTRRGRMLYARGERKEARHLLLEALEQAPQDSQARVVLGDLYRDEGRVADAEMAWLRALAFDPRNAELHARLGDLYLNHPSGKRAAEAVLFLSHALRLKPEWTALQLKLARACQATGDLQRALEHVKLYSAEVSDPARRREARILEEALRRVLAQSTGETPIVEPHPVEPAPLDAVEALNRARAYLSQGRPDAAMAELARLPEEARGAEVLDLEGRILHATGRAQEAAARLEAALEAAPDRADTHELLGRIRHQQGREEAARGHFRAAADLGNRAALYHLVRMETDREDPGVSGRLADLVNPARLHTLRNKLERYLAGGADAFYFEEARLLEADLNKRLNSIYITYAFVVLILLGAAGLAWMRVRGGADLATLVGRHPEAGPEVQRALAAIRHEVLKHNTMVLNGLVEALEAGADASGEAAYLRDNLFGEERDDSVMGRLLHYRAQLEQVGRSHGLRLNLRRRDSALAPILAGFARLEEAADDLQRLEQLRPSRRQRLLETLRQASQLLNVDGYGAVQDLLDTLRILTVDRELLEGVFRRIRREPAVAGLAVREPEYAFDIELPCGIPVPRPAFEDILGNLIRNALVSSARGLEEAAPVVIGLAVAADVDPITGLESIVFQVRDRSPEPLTTEMIRGRYIEGGLGISADLVARYEGSIDVVENLQGWGKAVTVSFPRAEAGREGST